ncbi:MAG: nucleotidyltransferase [Bacteroidetes bacterium]|nr:MAG: nucleotidyltransferase [Bacteroidota bacterium]
MQTTLLILAAGMGSRYGGIKQLDKVGPSGETIMDYSIYDALQAGFNKIVFVIRKSFEQQFRELIVQKLKPLAEVHLAFQEIDNLPPGYSFSAEREKPWGTGHAIWTARHLIHEPFAMINADDFYGKEAFLTMADFLKNKAPENLSHFAMCGYRLENTLSEHGTVSRGVCVTKDNLLQSIEEHTRISRKENGAISDTGGETEKGLTSDTSVSMNFWGFTPAIFDHLESNLHAFLEDYAQDKKKELYIPLVVDELIRDGKATVEVIRSTARWFGVTYREDKEMAVRRLKELTEMKLYPGKHVLEHLTPKK